MMRWLLLWLLLAPAVFATSGAPQVNECPVCGMKSVSMELTTYSQFEEPSRDLSDAPAFLFRHVSVCPGDLFASWTADWETVRPAEKAKIKDFLKDPALHLSAEEKAIIAGSEDAFRQSRWFLPLWARTCDELRTYDAAKQFDRQLLLHFSGSSVGADAPEWEKRLASLYRDKAIAALKEAATAEWPDAKDKRVFVYLRAELTRQAGRTADALALFREVIAAEKATKGDDELGWISRWAKEQALLCSSPKNAPAASARNAAAVSKADKVREAEAQAWRAKVLLPAVQKAMASGGLPVVKMPVDESQIRGARIPIDGKVDAPAQSLKDLARELYELWKEQAPAKRADTARIFIRLLRDKEETWESTFYPASLFLPEIAATDAGRAAISSELDGKWKSSFLQATCAYAAQAPASNAPFVNHPFTKEADRSLVVKLLMQRGDKSWLPSAIERLNTDEYLSDEIITYMRFTNLPEAHAAIARRAAIIRKKMAGEDYDNEGELETLLMIDELQTTDALAKLPLR